MTKPIIDCRQEFSDCPRCGKTIKTRYWSRHFKTDDCIREYAKKQAKEARWVECYNSGLLRHFGIEVKDVPGTRRRSSTFYSPQWAEAFAEALTRLDPWEQDLLGEHAGEFIKDAEAQEAIAALQKLGGVEAVRRLLRESIGMCVPEDPGQCTGRTATVPVNDYHKTWRSDPGLAKRLGLAPCATKSTKAPWRR